MLPIPDVILLPHYGELQSFDLHYLLIWQTYILLF
jgi:hypothetical protein